MRHVNLMHQLTQPNHENASDKNWESSAKCLGNTLQKSQGHEDKEKLRHCQREETKETQKLNAMWDRGPGTAR